MATKTEKLALARLNLLLDKIVYHNIDNYAVASLNWRVDVWSCSPGSLLEAIDMEIARKNKLKK